MTTYRHVLFGDLWTTTGKIRDDDGDVLVQLSAPTNAGSTRTLWVSEDDLAQVYSVAD